MDQLSDQRGTANRVLESLLRTLAATPPELSSPHVSGKRVLITGAGGSIGSALAHAVGASRPAHLVLLDTSENGLYQIDRVLREAGCRDAVPVLASICDRHRLGQLFAEHRPEIVFHAAALKHVPLMERNPFAAVQTNAAGTLTLAEIAAAHQVEHLILVSTDKAVDPRSIMGASKRVAELVLLGLGATCGTRMTAVRLGNVLGSQGSVLPLFLEQIAHNRPLTVTHSGAERYFMTMYQAVAALLAALDFRSSPAIVVPELGEPVRILDLAHRLLATHGDSVPIEFTGLRPGDKLTESLLSARERWVDPPVAGLRAIAGEAPSLASVEATIHGLGQAARQADLPHLLLTLAALVPEYEPSEILASRHEALA